LTLKSLDIKAKFLYRFELWNNESSTFGKEDYEHVAAELQLFLVLHVQYDATGDCTVYQVKRKQQRSTPAVGGIEENHGNKMSG
jgi:hypothetical protein